MNQYRLCYRNIPQLCVSGPWFYSLRISGVRKNINVVLLS